jgi:outer membrane receptor protein involved in Fe transport
MKKILTALAFCLAGYVVTAQMPGGFQRGGQQGQQIAGRFYGKVVDPSNKGVDAASVTLVTSRFDTATKMQKDVIVGGMLTTKMGEFSIENVPVFGRYKLRITGIGYKNHEQNVQFDMPNRSAMANAQSDPTAMLGALDKDLGNIKMDISENVLNTVTVTATKPQLQLGVDRKIFNVANNITSAGGTAVDVMKNVPSVAVDIDGNVTLRNNAPQIFVDGRPTNLTLDQIPADAIESVEIITNPSAKFDASGGTAGILNIVMKKNRRVGYSGNIRANVDSRGKVGGGGDINIRQNKINIFGSAMFNQRKSISTGYTTRTTGSLFTDQADKSTQNATFGFARGGFDYFIDNRNTITVNGTIVRGQPKSSNISNIDSARNGVPYKYDYRTTDGSVTFRNWGTQLSYKHNFPKSGHELTADATYNKGSNDNLNLIHLNDYDLPQHSMNHAYTQQQNIGGTNENVILQTDYTNPINDHSKFEAGARASIRRINSASTYATDSTNTGNYKQTSNVIYNSKDNVYGAYLNYSNQIKSFGYQIGLRAESSEYTGDLPNKGQTFNIKFPISLFPSLFLSEKLSDNDQLQLNYSRRINRPSFFQLFPFVDSSDIFNVTEGNPNLKPEFTNSFELSYSKTFKNRDNFLASIYYKHTTDLITRWYDTTTSKNYLINTYINANSSYVAGLELIGRNKITQWWDLTSNLNLFTAKIDVPGQTSPDQFPSYFLKLNNTFKLPKNFTFQLSGDYTSKIISSPGGSGSNQGGGGRFGGGGGFGGGPTTAAQGYIRPNYGVDAALRLDFLKNKTASISLNVNDIFRTRKYDAHSESTFFIQDIMRRRDPQIFRLNFNYRFGKFDASLFKRKNNKADNNVNDQLNF